MAIHLAIPLTLPVYNLALMENINSMSVRLDIDKEKNSFFVPPSSIMLYVACIPDSTVEHWVLNEFYCAWMFKNMYIVGSYPPLEKPSKCELGKNPSLPSTYWDRLLSFFEDTNPADFTWDYNRILFGLHGCCSELLAVGMHTKAKVLSYFLTGLDRNLNNITNSY